MRGGGHFAVWIGGHGDGMRAAAVHADEQALLHIPLLLARGL